MAKKSKEDKEKELVDAALQRSLIFTTVSDIINSNNFDTYGMIVGEDLENYSDEIISTGSSRFDAMLGGGFRPGFSLFYGDEESGKTAQGLVWGKNWQDKYGEDAYVVYVDAEGRMTKYKMLQSGLDLSEEKFFWFRGNTAEHVFGFIDKLVAINSKAKKPKKIFFILDSLDGLLRIEDKAKEFTEPQKVAGAAGINSLAAKKLSNPIHAYGHHLYQVTQIRAKNLMGGKGDGAKPGGGNAPKFYADIMGRFYKGWTETFIEDKDKKIIGNKTKIKITKSYNEVTNQTIDIPIKFRHIGGVWQAYEAYMSAMEWGWLEKKGSWFNFSEIFLGFLTQDNVNIDVSEVKLQGETKVLDFLEKMPDLVKYMQAKVKVLST